MNQHLPLKRCGMPLVGLIMLLAASSSHAQHKKARVLFIGNSYTYVNNMPQIVADMAAAAGDTLVYDVSAPGGAYFFNHLDPSFQTLNLLKAGRWDYVVLQEQSLGAAGPPYEFYPRTFNDAKLLIDSVRTYNPCAQIIFYMTWGRKNGFLGNCYQSYSWKYYCSYLGMDSVIRARYMEMADANKTAVSPVSAVWRHIRNNYPGIELYDPDQSHPSPAGSYAAACSFYTAIFKKPADSIRYDFSLSANDAKQIRGAATRVVFDSLDNWSIGRYEIQAAFKHNINSGLTVSFTNQSSNSAIYNWNFGDGETSSAANPVHTYRFAGNYNVRLISAAASCNDTVYAGIQVGQPTDPSTFIVAPNPAASVINISSGWFAIDRCRIQIFNWMGQLVHGQMASGTGRQTINVMGLATGIYTLQVSTATKMFCKKIVIRKP